MAYILIAAGCAGGCLGVTEPCVHDAPLPTLKVRTASASKTKCGWSEFGTASVPPKIYLSKTFAGSATRQTHDGGCGGALIATEGITQTGDCTYDRATCARTDTGSYTETFSYEPDHSLDTSDTTPTCDGNGGWGANVSYTATATLNRRDYGGTCIDSDTHSGYLSETLSSEFTTALLIADAEAAASFGSFATASVGSTVASFDLDADELTATVKHGEYYFELPYLGDATCYKLEWNETFTPESGSPTTTARSYLWDGIETDSPTHSISIPGTQGTWTITDLVASFACS